MRLLKVGAAKIKMFRNRAVQALQNVLCTESGLAILTEASQPIQPEHL